MSFLSVKYNYTLFILLGTYLPKKIKVPMKNILELKKLTKIVIFR